MPTTMLTGARALNCLSWTMVDNSQILEFFPGKDSIHRIEKIGRRGDNRGMDLKEGGECWISQ